MVCPLSLHLNWRVRATCGIEYYRLKYLLSHHCCQIAICHSHRLTPTTSTLTEYSDQEGLCFSKQPPLRRHLSAVGVVTA